MLRVELGTQLLRLRTLIALACLAAVPVMAAVSFAHEAGHRNGSQGGLFGASPYSALNHAMASLEFAGPLLLPIIVSLLAAAIASADRDWGVLRYLYVAPVTRSRLLTSKLAATALTVAIAVACTVAAGLVAGVVVFGWHPFHLIGAANLTTGAALARSAASSAYVLCCMCAMGAIAFTLGLVLPRGAEAVAAAVGFVVVASIVNGQAALHHVAVILPVHYWQDWTELFTPGTTARLGTGILVQVVWIAVCSLGSSLVLHRRDPAA